MGRCAHEQRWLMWTQIAAQVGGTLSYLVEAVERRIVPVLARTRHDGRFGGALHCDRHPSSSRPARPGLGCVVFLESSSGAAENVKKQTCERTTPQDLETPRLEKIHV